MENIPASHKAVAQIVAEANRSEIHRNTGISLSGVSRILSGRRNAKSGNLGAIAVQLGISMDDLHAYLTYVKKVLRTRNKVRGRVTAA